MARTKTTASELQCKFISPVSKQTLLIFKIVCFVSKYTVVYGSHEIRPIHSAPSLGQSIGIRYIRFLIFIEGPMPENNKKKINQTIITSEIIENKK